MHLLRLVKTTFPKIFALSLIIFSRNFGIFCCFIWFQHFNLFENIYFFKKWEIKIRFRSTVFFITIILGWALYFTIALMTGSLIFSDGWSVLLSCGILRLVTTLEKNSLKMLVVSLSLLDNFITLNSRYFLIPDNVV